MKLMQILNIIFIVILFASVLTGYAKHELWSEITQFQEWKIFSDDLILFGILPLLVVLFSLIYLAFSLIFLFQKREENGFVKFAYWMNLIVGVIVLTVIFYLFITARDHSFYWLPYALFPLYFFIFSPLTFISFILFLIGFFKSHKNI